MAPIEVGEEMNLTKEEIEPSNGEEVCDPIPVTNRPDAAICHEPNLTQEDEALVKEFHAMVDRQRGGSCVISPPPPKPIVIPVPVTQIAEHIEIKNEKPEDYALTVFLIASRQNNASEAAGAVERYMKAVFPQIGTPAPAAPPATTAAPPTPVKKKSKKKPATEESKAKWAKFNGVNRSKYKTWKEERDAQGLISDVDMYRVHMGLPPVGEPVANSASAGASNGSVSGAASGEGNENPDRDAKPKSEASTKTPSKTKK